jgi:hypothetical protein
MRATRRTREDVIGDCLRPFVRSDADGSARNRDEEAASEGRAASARTLTKVGRPIYVPDPTGR